MPKTLQLRRGTTSELSTETGAVGELFVDTTKDTVVVMDGSTAGGFPLARESEVLGSTDPVVTGTLTADAVVAGTLTTDAIIADTALLGTVAITDNTLSPTDAYGNAGVLTVDGGLNVSVGSVTTGPVNFAISQPPMVYYVNGYISATVSGGFTFEQIQQLANIPSYTQINLVDPAATSYGSGQSGQMVVFSAVQVTSDRVDLYLDSISINGLGSFTGGSTFIGAAQWTWNQTATTGSVVTPLQVDEVGVNINGTFTVNGQPVGSGGADLTGANVTIGSIDSCTSIRIEGSSMNVAVGTTFQQGASFNGGAYLNGNTVLNGSLIAFANVDIANGASLSTNSINSTGQLTIDTDAGLNLVVDTTSTSSQAFIISGYPWSNSQIMFSNVEFVGVNFDANTALAYIQTGDVVTLRETNSQSILTFTVINKTQPSFGSWRLTADTYLGTGGVDSSYGITVARTSGSTVTPLVANATGLAVTGTLTVNGQEITAGGGEGGASYDQPLYTFSDVLFNSVTADSALIGTIAVVDNTVSPTDAYGNAGTLTVDGGLQLNGTVVYVGETSETPVSTASVSKWLKVGAGVTIPGVPTDYVFTAIQDYQPDIGNGGAVIVSGSTGPSTILFRFLDNWFDDGTKAQVARAIPVGTQLTLLDYSGNNIPYFITITGITYSDSTSIMYNVNLDSGFGAGFSGEVFVSEVSFSVDGPSTQSIEYFYMPLYQ